MAGRPPVTISLTEDERSELKAWKRRRKTAQALALRAHIILLCDEDYSNLEIADELSVAPQTVSKWRKRFSKHRLQGLFDAPRSGAGRRISDEQVRDVITRTLESKPADATHWSTRKMAATCEMSHDSVKRIWNAFGLQPHRSESFQISTDPFFIEKVRDVVGLYMSPPENALVFCVDEKSQIQALERSQPVLPMRQGQPERQTHDYYRHGTVSLFAALDIATGEVLGKCYNRHRQEEFVDFLRTMEKEVPKDMEVHLVLDNYATHKAPKVRRWLAKRQHWHLHFIPTHSSWLNQVERWFARITTDMIRRGVFRSVPQLRKSIKDYIESNNRKPKPFKWIASADLILGKVEALCDELVCHDTRTSRCRGRRGRGRR